MITARDIDRIATLQPLSDSDRAWLAEQATERVADSGEVLFKQGEPARVLYFLLEGTLVFRAGQEGQEQGYFVIEEGSISGMLPRSRMKVWAGTGRAAEPSRLACFDSEKVDTLIERIPALDQIFAAVLADRIREATRVEQQQDKLMALGKLSAGLAHELNNPAAAIQRTVAALRARIDELPSRVHALTAHRLNPDQLAFACSIGDAGAPAQKLTTVQRSQREDALADWLEAHNIESAFELAETFVESGLDESALDDIAARLDPAALPDVLRWVESTLAATLMLREIAASADRIAAIVLSVKGYSHMDQAPVHAPTDVHAGLDSTLTMLAYEIRKHGIKVDKKYADDLPPISANAGELNQVWTNLIDNAIDAMPEGGELKLVTRKEGDSILVEIIDTGEGIPEDVQQRVFEPFFTTKGVGEGTGLGLDVVRRIVARSHRGQVTVRSEKGCTNFTVRLPIASAAETGDAAEPKLTT